MRIVAATTSPSVPPHHTREIGHARARRRQHEPLSVPQSGVGPFLLAGVKLLQVDPLGEVEDVGVARVDDGGAGLECLPVVHKMLQHTQIHDRRTKRFW